jgi:hypothetical protein
MILEVISGYLSDRDISNSICYDADDGYGCVSIPYDRVQPYRLTIHHELCSGIVTVISNKPDPELGLEFSQFHLSDPGLFGKVFGVVCEYLGS